MYEKAVSLGNVGTLVYLCCEIINFSIIWSVMNINAHKPIPEHIIKSRVKFNHVQVYLVHLCLEVRNTANLTCFYIN